MKKSIIASLIVLSVSVYCSGQKIINGKVTSKKDGLPIAGAIVNFKGKICLTVYTDASGNFNTSIPSSAETIEISATGFVTKTQGFEDATMLSFELIPTDGSFESTGSEKGTTGTSAQTGTGKTKLIKTSIRTSAIRSVQPSRVSSQDEKNSK